MTVHPTGRVELCGKTTRQGRQLRAFLHRVLAPLYMAGSCYGCEVCVAACPYGAMIAAHTVNPTRCTSCMQCTFVCPSGGKLSEHAVKVLEEAGLNLGDRH